MYSRSALLIAGDGLYFLNEVLEFREFLKKDVGIENIRIIPTAYLPVEKIMQKIEEFMKNANGPVLLIFVGHGSKYGWSLSFDISLSYEKIAELLANYPSQLMVINDCCYGGALVEALKKYDASDARVSTIVAIDSEHDVGPGLILEVLKAWRNGCIYTPKVWRLINVSLVFKRRTSLGSTMDYIFEWVRCAISERLHLWFPSRFRIMYGGKVDDLSVCEVIEKDAGIWQKPGVGQRWGAEFDGIFFTRLE